MRVVRAALARLALAICSLAVSMLVSLVIVRRLAPLEYGLYTIASRRLVRFTTVSSMFTAVWGYREASLQAVADHMISSTPVLGLNLIVSFIAAYVASGDALLSLGLAVYASLAGYATAALQALSGARFILSELLRFTGRVAALTLVYATLVVLRFGIWGAIIAQVISCLLVATLVFAVCRSRPRFRREWFRWWRVPLASMLGALFFSLDAVIVASIAGGETVGMYFACILPVAVAVDVLSRAGGHTAAYAIKTGDFRSVVSAYRIVGYVTAVAMACCIARPEQVLATLNPLYLGLTTHLVLASTVLYTAQTTTLVMSTLTSAYGREVGESARLVRLSRDSAILTLLHPTLAAIAALVLREPRVVALAWILTCSTSHLVNGLYTAHRYAPGVAKMVLRGYTLPVVTLTCLSALTAYVLAPRGYAMRFWENLPILLKTLTVASIPLAVTLLDPAVRLGLRKVLRGWFGRECR